jgi:hypothetical protein
MDGQFQWEEVSKRGHLKDLDTDETIFSMMWTGINLLSTETRTLILPMR